MAVNLSSFAGAGWQLFSNNGVPLAGGLIYSYAAGTSTPAATYTTSAGSIANTNPIVLNAFGRTANEIWLTAGSNYKFILRDSTGNLIGTYDNISGINDFTGASASILADLASTTDNAKGDALIGFRQSNSSGFLTGAVGKTVNAKFQDYINVKDFGAVGDGTTNDAAAFSAALTAVATTGQDIYVPAGTYKINSVLSTTGHLNMFGDGEKSVLDFSGITSGSSGITVTGTATEIQVVSSASAGNLSVVFASAPSLVTGDVFFLFDDAVLWNSIRPYYYDGEWLECREVSGNTASTTSPLYSSYSATVNAYKLNSKPKVSFRNLKLNGGANIFGLLKITFCDKPILENVILYNENYQGVEIDRCYRFMATNCVMYNKGTGTLDDYALIISNSQKGQITGGDYYARRHGITIGGGSGTGAVTNRNIKISNLTISNDINSGVYSADMHGNMQDVVYQGCTIYQGGGWAGMDCGYDNCIIYSALGGWCVYASEVKGGEIFIRNCKLFTKSDPSTISRGIVDCGGNSNPFTASTNATVSIIVENTYVYADAASATTNFMVMSNLSSSAYINIYIDGLVGNVNAMGAILRTRLDSGTAYSQAIVVDNISNFPAGTYLHVPQGSAYLNKPHRMMRQTGSVVMTATSGTKQTVNAGTNYRYVYPRPPQVFVSVGSITVGFSNSAGENVGPAIYQIDSASFRPALVSTSNANWTATIDMTVNYLSQIAEV
jgi:hypothetical protein